MSNITISIADKCGLDHAGGAFIIDETGTILVINMNVKEWGGGMAALPVRFDMAEYSMAYSYIKTQSHRIERTDIGYYAADGRYHPADAHMRRAKQMHLIAELIEHLDNTSASLETMLAYLESPAPRKPIPPHDHKQRSIVCGNARLFLLQFKTPEEDEEQDGDVDKSALPHGVVRAQPDGDVVCFHCQAKCSQSLLDTITNHHFCCRECLDNANEHETPVRKS